MLVPFLIHFWLHFEGPKRAFRLRLSSTIAKPVLVMNGKRVNFLTRPVYFSSTVSLVCLSGSLSVCLPASLCISVCPSVCLSACLSVCLSVCLYVCLCTCLSVFLSVFVCLSRLRVFAQRQSLRSRATLASSAPPPGWTQ